ncbi:hypothetical protein B0T13DRAFT_502555 [Neurospora crassa]|nr:hypothetical protein B0T13DRAFT_502555 [Neurospora crassa]
MMGKDDDDSDKGPFNANAGHRNKEVLYWAISEQKETSLGWIDTIISSGARCDLSNVFMNATVSAVAWFRIPDIPARLKLSTEPSPLGKGTIDSHPATSSEKER